MIKQSTPHGRRRIYLYPNTKSLKHNIQPKKREKGNITRTLYHRVLISGYDGTTAKRFQKMCTGYIFCTLPAYTAAMGNMAGRESDEFSG
mmetsp:Transcript_6111/g.12805  ORF Transcript_6111/g.12805 Transcript_6111/m.12805 type:complete len:90 (+) Transcript_6111:1756-2025(+)